MTDKTLQESIRLGIRLLGQRAHSRAELLAKLMRKGVDEATAEAAMLRLENLGLIDDRNFASACLQSISKRRPEGKAKVRVRLMQKGLAEELVEEALREYDPKELCLAAAEKKMRSLAGAPETKRKKLETFLRNRGFDWQAIKESVEIVTRDR